jgi:hypothetical protein
MSGAVTSVKAEICDAEPDHTSPYYEVLEIPLTPATTYHAAYRALKEKFRASQGWLDMGGAGTMVERRCARGRCDRGR